MKLLIFLSLLSLSSLVSSIHLGSEEAQTGFETFLHQAMDGYPAWLVRNNLDPMQDPTLINHLTYQGKLINFTATLGNTSFIGHSVGAYVHISQVNLLSGTFKIEKYGGNISLTGDYEIEGHIAIHDVPVRGSGMFGIRQWNDSDVWMAIKGFGISPEGYIDLDVAEFTDEHHLHLEADYFEGLEAGGFEEDMTQLLFQVYDDDVDFSIDYRMTPLMLRYLKEVFAITHIDTIINTKPQ